VWTTLIRLRGAVAALALVMAAVVGIEVVEGQTSDELAAAEAAEHVGEEATVCGLVVHTVFVEADRRQPTYLNFGKPWPDQEFAVVIRGRHRPRFETPPEEAYADKEICVSGLIEVEERIPQIIVTRPEQIIVRQATGTAPVGG